MYKGPDTGATNYCLFPGFLSRSLNIFKILTLFYLKKENEYGHAIYQDDS